MASLCRAGCQVLDDKAFKEMSEAVSGNEFIPITTKGKAQAFALPGVDDEIKGRQEAEAPAAAEQSPAYPDPLDDRQMPAQPSAAPSSRLATPA